MTLEIALVLLILVVVLVAFVIDKIAPDIIALGTMVLLMTTGILTPEEGISGFSNPATITILALFFVSQALNTTGIISVIGDYLLKISNSNVALNVFIIICVTAFCSAFINTTAVVIVFLPVVLRISKAKNISPTLLLMPLSFGAIIGGASTTIGTSTNLIIKDIAKSSGIVNLNIFEFTEIGLALFGVILIYMILVSSFLIKPRKKKDNLIEDYNVKNYFTEIRIDKGSNWIGKTIDKIPTIKKLEIDIIEIVRGTHTTLNYFFKREIEENDILLVRVNAQNFPLLKELKGVHVTSRGDIEDKDLKQKGLTLMEIVVNTNSPLIGKTIIEYDFKSKFGATVLGLIGGQNRFFSKRMKKLKIRFGDTLLIETTEEQKKSFYENNDFIVIQEVTRPEYRKKKQWIALTFIVGIVSLAAFGIFPILVAALTGATILLATGCISINEAYKGVEWKIIFLLAGLIPLGIALEKTGASIYIGDLISNLVVGMPTYWALFCLYMITTFITSIIYNNATAIILAPVIISLAPALQVDEKALIALLMFAANCCFMTPIGYQTNLLIYGPGQYKFRDFLLIGGPLCVLLGLLCSFLVMTIF